MTEPKRTYQKTPLGRRVAAYRKQRGFSTPDQLAAATEGRVSAATITNIEAGRKRDPSVSDLLAISYGLAVSPLSLLFDLDNPLAPVDSPDLFPGEWQDLPALSVLDVFRLRTYMFEVEQRLSDPTYKMDLIESLRTAALEVVRIDTELEKIASELPAVEGASRSGLEGRKTMLEMRRRAAVDLFETFTRTAPVSGIEVPKGISGWTALAADSRAVPMEGRPNG